MIIWLVCGLAVFFRTLETYPPYDSFIAAMLGFILSMLFGPVLVLRFLMK